MKAWVKTMRGSPGLLHLRKLSGKETAVRVYRVLSHAGPILFCNIQPSGLFRLFGIYDEVQSPETVCFLPWSASLRNSHFIPSFPSPTFNQHSIGIRYMSGLENSLPCWGRCQLRYWIYNRHNPNPKTLLPK